MARIVNIQPGQLAATMTFAPENNLDYTCHQRQSKRKGRHDTTHILIWCGLSVHTYANVPQRSQASSLL